MDLEFKVKPWEHQRKALERSWLSDYFAFLFDPGCGKTMTAINFLRAKEAIYGRFPKTLVICPVVTMENWKREFAQHTDHPESTITLLTGAETKRMKDLHEAKGFIFIINYDGARMKLLATKLRHAGFEAVIYDESHKCKNHNTRTTQICQQLAERAKYRIILTGTMILNTPLDIYSQWRLLDNGKTFGKNYWTFRGNYFYDKNANMPAHVKFPDWVPKPGALEQIRKLMQPYCAIAKKSECLDLPPLLRKTIEVPLGQMQSCIYQAMKKDFLATFDGGKVAVAEFAMTKALRLLQVLSGFCPVESGEGDKDVHVFEENPRLEALMETLQEILPEKVIVWATFHQNYKDITEALKKENIKYVELHGKVSAKDRQPNIDAFNNDPEVKVLVGHPGSGGIGVNLTAASYMIYYTRGFSLEHDLQSEARNYRGGSEIHEKITRIDIVAPDTLDVHVLKRLANKMAIGEKMIGEIANELAADRPLPIKNAKWRELFERARLRGVGEDGL